MRVTSVSHALHPFGGPAVVAPAPAFIRRAVASALASSTAVAEVVGVKVYPLAAKQTAAPPYLTHQLVSLTRERNVRGPTGQARALYQFTAVAKVPADCEALAEALRQLLDGPASADLAAAFAPVKVIGATLAGERDHAEWVANGNGDPLYVTSVDYLIRYREPRPRGL